VGNSTVFHYSTHAVVLNYRMEAGSGAEYGCGYLLCILGVCLGIFFNSFFLYFLFL